MNGIRIEENVKYIGDRTDMPHATDAATALVYLDRQVETVLGCFRLGECDDVCHVHAPIIANGMTPAMARRCWVGIALSPNFIGDYACRATTDVPLTFSLPAIASYQRLI
jgi:hypothetical protein